VPVVARRATSFTPSDEDIAPAPQPQPPRLPPARNIGIWCAISVRPHHRGLADGGEDERGLGGMVLEHVAIVLECARRGERQRNEHEDGLRLGSDIYCSPRLSRTLNPRSLTYMASAYDVAGDKC